MTEMHWEGHVRRKRPRAAAYCRYDDQDILLDWIDEHAHFGGMHTIDGTKHGEPMIERWYLNGQTVDLAKGYYLVVEDGRVHAYTGEEMAEYFDVTEELE